VTPQAPLPPPAAVTTWQIAEAVSARWLRWLGHADAQVTNAGADGGIDVVSNSALAQVKFHVRPAGRPALQALQGAAMGSARQLYFFSSGGYASTAIQYAEAMGIACFRLHPDGSVTPHSSAARSLYRAAASNRAGDPTWVDPAVAAEEFDQLMTMALLAVAGVSFFAFMIFNETHETLGQVLAVTTIGRYSSCG
jgi:hypothetical protein